MLFNSVSPCPRSSRLMPCEPPDRLCEWSRFGLGATDQGAIVEHQVDVADRDHVAVAQQRRIDARAVDERPVDAARRPGSRCRSGLGTNVA